MTLLLAASAHYKADAEDYGVGVGVGVPTPRHPDEWAKSIKDTPKKNVYVYVHMSM